MAQFLSCSLGWRLVAIMPGGLIKRLSKSATDLSPCKKKTRSNSYDEELEVVEYWSTMYCPALQSGAGEGERPGSAQSSVSVPAISLIGGRAGREVRRRGRSRSEHGGRGVERSPAAEIGRRRLDGGN